jgi:hypothetical protein
VTRCRLPQWSNEPNSGTLSVAHFSATRLGARRSTASFGCISVALPTISKQSMISE